MDAGREGSVVKSASSNVFLFGLLLGLFLNILMSPLSHLGQTPVQCGFLFTSVNLLSYGTKVFKSCVS